MHSSPDGPLDRRHIVESRLTAVLPHLDVARLAGKNIFMTGGTGFFGSWLLSAIALLNCSGAGIRATVLSRSADRFLDRQPHWRGTPWLSFVAGNVRDFEWPVGCFDLVIHAATDTSASAHANQAAMFDDVVMGSRRVLDFALNAQAGRILLASSGAVYGPQPSDTDAISEDRALAKGAGTSADAYAQGKRAMESLADHYHRLHGIQPVVARCFAFSGPGLPLDGHFAIGNFVRDALFEEAIRVGSDGTPVRSYLDAADLAVWLLRLLDAGVAGQAYNVGSDAAISIRELAFLVQRIVAPHKEVRFGAASGHEQRQRYVPSIQRARVSLGLDVWTSLEDSVRAMALYASRA